MSLKFGTDGVRGRALEELTVPFVVALGRAAAEELGAGAWIVGHDGRESGPALVGALCAGLVEAGAVPAVAGIVPTPAVAAVGEARGIATAMVTASHNPWDDNGIKLFAPGGLKLSDDVQAAIERRLALHLAASADRTDSALRASAPPALDGIGAEYVNGLVARFPTGCLSRLRIVVDAANGAMSTVAPAALRGLGATVVETNVSPNGRNINDGCGATHPEPLCSAVVAEGADLGLAFDGDGDRIIAVDHLGRVVDGDRLIALAALHLREHGQLPGDTVVVTVMSNLGFHRAMAEAGVRVVTTPVGDRYVLEALDAGGFAVGGEQSGHIIYRRQATTGDGLLASLHLAQFVAEHHRPLAEVAATVMTSFPQVLVNVRVAERRADLLDQLAGEVAAAEARLGDEGRVLLRASGTEPLVRVMVEAPTEALALDVASGLADAVRSRFA